MIIFGDLKGDCFLGWFYNYQEMYEGKFCIYFGQVEEGFKFSVFKFFMVFIRYEGNYIFLIILEERGY